MIIKQWKKFDFLYEKAYFPVHFQITRSWDYFKTLTSMALYLNHYHMF